MNRDQELMKKVLLVLLVIWLVCMVTGCTDRREVVYVQGQPNTGTQVVKVIHVPVATAEHYEHYEEEDDHDSYEKKKVYTSPVVATTGSVKPTTALTTAKSTYALPKTYTSPTTATSAYKAPIKSYTAPTKKTSTTTRKSYTSTSTSTKR
jgi:hypothetical protein